MARPAVGSQVSHYRLDRVLGTGGMGEVFLAHDLTLDRRVAIKYLTVVNDDVARRRLLSEARAVAALDHPSICTVYEVVTDDVSGDFIVMAYVEGETLATRMVRGGRMPPAEALAILTPLLQALSVAHRAGVVHRDIKPQNIIITPSGQPKLLDFGIAKRAVMDAHHGDATTERPLTMEGEVVGTLAYMSPEQIQGRPVDGRSDLFSLGCVFYECLTGLRPFASPSRAETIGQLLHVDQPLPSTVVPSLPPLYDTLCADLLRKLPSERFQSADEVLGSIRGLVPTQREFEATGRTVVPQRRFSRRQWVIASVALMAVLSLVGAGWLWWGTSALPAASPEATQWFNRGVEKLREGSYAGARSALIEAVRLSPDFLQAHLRLAEAYAELDDDDGAQEALLRVNALLPTTAKLAGEDRLRLEAVRSSVLREHERAIAAYGDLAKLTPGTASVWVDVGRAEDAAGRRVAAMGHYAQAVALDGQYAAAHQRLAVVQSQGGQSVAAIASLDEAIRLHQAGANVEGEAEATLRKASVHIARREIEAARRAVQRVSEIAADSRYVALRLRAEFARARLAMVNGQFQEAESLSREAIDQAISARMLTIASDGVRDLGTTLLVAGRYAEADVQFNRAIDLAIEQKADRAEMQARLQQAALRLQQSRHADVIAMVDAPLQFFTEGRYVRNEAEAKSILAQAHEGLEHYEQARQLANDVLALATSIEDRVLTNVSLENLAGQAERLGQLPDALALRERLEKIHRDVSDHTELGYDLVNRAELLIRLGRGAEAGALLDEVDRAIAAGTEAYKGRRRRVFLMRALRASVEGHFSQVEAFSRAAVDPDTPPTNGTRMFAQVLAEYARGHLGISRTSTTTIASWATQPSQPALGRELAYWVGETLLLRRDYGLAAKVAQDAWSAPPAQTNAELRWRLGAVAAKASHAAAAGSGATMRTAANADLRVLLGQWSGQGAAYIARPDLAALRKGIS